MKSNVYFLDWKNISDFSDWSESINAFSQLKNHDYAAIKIHFGEEGNKGFIKPEFARAIAKKIKAKDAFPFLSDANTIYVGERADAYHHLIVAAKHGFTIEKCSCPIIIADGLRGNSGVDVEVNLNHFKSVSIANTIYYSDFILLMSHFKGHEVSGFGGALKNAGMGCATRAGKYAMHDKLKPKINGSACIKCGACIKWCSAGALSIKDDMILLNENKCVGCGECILTCSRKVFRIPWDEHASATQEKFVEYASGTLKNKNYFCFNFLNFITKHCDCFKSDGSPLLRDIGVLASNDPVALDQASVDMANEIYGGDFCKSIHPAIDANVQLEYAEKIGLGTRDYQLCK